MKSPNKPNRYLPPILIISGIIILIGMAFMLSQTNNRLSTTITNTPSATQSVAGIERITLEEAKIAFDQKNAVFLDVRSFTSYEDGHIPGAISMPFTELETRFQELDPTKWIITYCT